jgi:hypothetical protein
MKLLLAALALTRVAAFSSSSGEFNSIFGNKHDAMSVMSKLTGMMGAAQQKLSVAEHHQKKVVNRIRKETDAFLEDEAKVYAQYISEYSAELSKATDELKGVVATAKAGLAKSEASKSSNLNDWRDPEVEKRAKLSAQVSFAERGIKKAERHLSRQVKEAEERAEETMEDEAQKLGMKLGDMSPVVEKAKKTLESIAEKPTEAVKEKAKPDDKAAQVNLKALQDNIAKEVSKDQKGTTDANKKLDGFLTKTDKDVAEKAAKIQKDLDVSQKAEIEKVLGKKEETKAKYLPKKAKSVAVTKANDSPKKAKSVAVTKANESPKKAKSVAVKK